MPDPRRRLASDLGCILDCNLNTGLTATGEPATDNTALLNAFLATASATNPVSLTLDGPTLTTGLLIHGGHTTIEGIGPGSGLFLKSASNSHAIRNHSGPASRRPRLRPPRTCHELKLRHHRPQPAAQRQPRQRHLRQHRHTASPTTVGRQDHALRHRHYVNCTAVWLEDLILHDLTTYAVCLSNCAAVVCRNLRITTPRDRNCDGIHFNGPASDIHISDCFFQTGDDAIALNAPEGFGGDISPRRHLRTASSTTPPPASASTAHGHSAAQPTPSATSAHHQLHRRRRKHCPLHDRLPAARPRRHHRLPHGQQLLPRCLLLGHNQRELRRPHLRRTTPGIHPPVAGFFLWIPLPVTLSSVTLANCRIYRTTRGNAPASRPPTPQTPPAAPSSASSPSRASPSRTRPARPSRPSPFLLDTENVTVDELYIGSLDPANITALAPPSTSTASTASVRPRRPRHRLPHPRPPHGRQHPLPQRRLRQPLHQAPRQNQKTLTPPALLLPPDRPITVIPATQPCPPDRRNPVIPTEVEGPASSHPNSVLPSTPTPSSLITPNPVIPTEVEGPASSITEAAISTEGAKAPQRRHPRIPSPPNQLRAQRGNPTVWSNHRGAPTRQTGAPTTSAAFPPTPIPRTINPAATHPSARLCREPVIPAAIPAVSAPRPSSPFCCFSS